MRVLQYLVALEETSHFGEAAIRCDVTQSTLSLQVKRLENYLGVELFDRRARPVTPTAAGREVLVLARVAIHVWQDMKQVAERHRTGGTPDDARQQPD